MYDFSFGFHCGGLVYLYPMEPHVQLYIKLANFKCPN